MQRLEGFSGSDSSKLVYTFCKASREMGTFRLWFVSDKTADYKRNLGWLVHIQINSRFLSASVTPSASAGAYALLKKCMMRYHHPSHLFHYRFFYSLQQTMGDAPIISSFWPDLYRYTCTRHGNTFLQGDSYPAQWLQWSANTSQWNHGTLVLFLGLKLEAKPSHCGKHQAKPSKWGKLQQIQEYPVFFFSFLIQNAFYSSAQYWLYFAL